MNLVRALLLSLLSAALFAACGGGGGGDGGGGSVTPPPQNSVTVAPTTASVMVGQQIQLAATVKDASGAILPTNPVTWASSNTAVATVTSTGLVRAVSLGQVTITASNEGQSGSAALTTTTGLTFATVSTGDMHTCGVTTGGDAYCWGDNSSGQLGNGTTVSSSTPVLVPSIKFATVSAGGRHTCGVNPSGIGYCWGSNSVGQIGAGMAPLLPTLNPTPVIGGLSFATISAGGSHTCGVTTAGFPYCWGDNTYGQLGNGTTLNSSEPVAVSGGFPFASVSAGGRHTCGPGATLSPKGGLMYCWGDNTSGELGNGTTISRSTPVLIANFDPFHAWSESVSAGSNHTCAVAYEGGFGMAPVAYCWGDNSSGQLGNGTLTSSAVPVSVGVFNSTVLSAGTFFSCAVDNFSQAYCWGNNSSGQLGNGTSTNSPRLATVVGGLKFVRISGGGRHACGIVSGDQPGSSSVSGAVYCWGDNSSGQLGNRWATSSPIPVNVAGSS